VHDYAFKVMMIIYFGFGVILSYIITHKLGYGVEGAWVANGILTLTAALFFILK